MVRYQTYCVKPPSLATEPDPISAMVMEAYHQQSRLGWENFFHGRVKGFTWSKHFEVILT
jgi:hypothetical protein